MFNVGIFVGVTVIVGVGVIVFVIVLLVVDVIVVVEVSVHVSVGVNVLVYPADALFNMTVATAVCVPYASEAMLFHVELNEATGEVAFIV
jgi:hypothetical protein